MNQNREMFYSDFNYMYNPNMPQNMPFIPNNNMNNFNINELEQRISNLENQIKNIERDINMLKNKSSNVELNSNMYMI